MKARDVLKSDPRLGNELATITVSPRGTANGPSSVAAASPATSVVLPLARATESADDATPEAKAPRMLQGQPEPFPEG